MSNGGAHAMETAGDATSGSLKAPLAACAESHALAGALSGVSESTVTEWQSATVAAAPTPTA